MQCTLMVCCIKFIMRSSLITWDDVNRIQQSARPAKDHTLTIVHVLSRLTYSPNTSMMNLVRISDLGHLFVDMLSLLSVECRSPAVTREPALARCQNSDFLVRLIHHFQE
jgi:hypothetical protein